MFPQASKIAAPSFAIALVLFVGCSGGGEASKADLSTETIGKITLGAKLGDVEKLVGAPGTRLSELRMNEFAENRKGVLNNVPAGRTRYVWQQSNVLFFVDVDDSGTVTGTNRMAGSR